MKKKYYLAILIILISFVDTYSQTDTQNYIRTRNYTNESGTTYLDQLQYFDGLGRFVQTVHKAVTPGTDIAARKDLVILQEYDTLGREDKAWLPAVVSGNNGAYVAPEDIK